MRVARRRSRKIKLVHVREPSGRLSRAEDEREFAPAAIRRLQDAALSGMADRRWGTQLGRLHLARKIDHAMLAAGERWAELASEYHAAINTPPGARSAALERGSLGTAPDPWSEAGTRQASREVAAVNRMREAHAVLVGAGMLAERTVRAICERDEAIAGFEIVNLVHGLGMLAQFWDLTEKPSHVR